MPLTLFERLTQGSSLANFVRAILYQAKQLRLGQTAASLAFLTMLALVPLFSVGLWALTLSPRFSKLKESFLLLVGEMFLPAVSDVVLRYLNEFATHVNQLPIWAAAGFVLTGLLALNTFEKTLNLIWASTVPRAASRRFFFYSICLLAGPQHAGAVKKQAQAMASPVLNTVITWYADTRQEQKAAGSLVRQAWPFFIILLLLALAYRFVPRARVGWQFALLGASVSAALIEALKWALGSYLTSLPGLKTVYGALAVIPILLIWLNGVWLAILIGAVFAAVLQRPLLMSRQTVPLPLMGSSITAEQLHQLLLNLKDELTQHEPKTNSVNPVWRRVKDLTVLTPMGMTNRALLIQALVSKGIVHLGVLPGSALSAGLFDSKEAGASGPFSSSPSLSSALLSWNPLSTVDLRQLAWQGH